MKGQEVKRSAFLKRLLAEQRKKLPDELSPDEREAQAQALMTRLLGERWKEEVGPEVEIVAVEVAPQDDQEGVEFMKAAKEQAAEDGVGLVGVEFDEGRSAPKCKHSIKDQIVSLLDRLVGK